MISKATGVRFSRAERFLLGLAASLPGTDPVAALEDAGFEATARRMADYFALKVEEGDFESVLDVLEDTLEREERLLRRLERPPSAGRTRPAPRSRVDLEPKFHPEVDPYYWG